MSMLRREHHARRVKRAVSPGGRGQTAPHVWASARPPEWGGHAAAGPSIGSGEFQHTASTATPRRRGPSRPVGRHPRRTAASPLPRRQLVRPVEGLPLRGVGREALPQEHAAPGRAPGPGPAAAPRPSSPPAASACAGARPGGCRSAGTRAATGRRGCAAPRPRRRSRPHRRRRGRRSPDLELLVRLGRVGHLDLDLDVDRLDALAVARLQEAEVVDEPPRHPRRPGPRPPPRRRARRRAARPRRRGRARRRCGRCRSRTGPPPTASRSQRPSEYRLASRISANVPTLAIASSCGAAVARRDLAALADQHDAERRRVVEAAPDHQAVPLLEHVQRQREPGREDGVEREEGDLHVVRAG